MIHVAKLRNHTGTLILAQWKTLSHLLRFPTRAPFCSRIQSSISLAWGHHVYRVASSLSASQAFLVFSRPWDFCTGQVFCRLTFNLGWSNIFSRLDQGYGFGGRIPLGEMLLLLHHRRGCVVSAGPITDSLCFDPLVTVVSAPFLHYNDVACPVGVIAAEKEALTTSEVCVWGPSQPA